MALHQPDQVREWLENDGMVEACGFDARDDPAYAIDVTTAETSLRIVRDHGDAPLRVVGETTVAPELLVAFDEDDHRRNFLSQLTAVVSGTDGGFAFLDGAGEPCTLRETRRVRFENRVYPGATTRHRVMTAVQDVSNAVGHVEMVVENFHQYEPPGR